MRILHIMNHLSDRGNGIVNLAVDLGIEQAKAGHTVAVAAGHGGHEKLLQQFGIAYYHLDQKQAPKNLVVAFRICKRILDEFQPDIIHVHMRVGLLIGWFWSRLKHVPVVAHLHNVHDRSSLLMGLADRIIAVSSSVKRSMERQGIRSGKLRVVLNGTLCGERMQQSRSSQPAPLQKPAIITVGGMNDRKGIEELIAAFNLVAEEFAAAHLYLVGHGPERDKFERQASESLFRERIHFEGFQSDPMKYMLAADVFVLASRRESFGLVLTEAREAGCAIIATNVDGIPEALDGGEAGFLVPPKDPVALAAGLRMFLEDEELRNSWRQKAQKGMERLTTAQMAREVEKVYRELVPAAENVF